MVAPGANQCYVELWGGGGYYIIFVIILTRGRRGVSNFQNFFYVRLEWPLVWTGQYELSNFSYLFQQTSTGWGNCVTGRPTMLYYILFLWDY